MDLYRYISFSSFVDIVQSSTLCFNNPLKDWPDKYEGFIFRAMKTDEGRKKILDLLPRKVNKTFTDEVLKEEIVNRTKYLCWSTESNSVAMWSVYSYHKEALMISTTCDKLEQLYHEDQKVGTMAVDYVPNLSLEKEILIVSRLKIFMPNIFKSKRDAFSHENEIRAYISSDPSKKSTDASIKVTIPCVKDFINGVLVHPEAKDWYVDVVEKYCQLNGIKFLGQSQLYKFKC